MDPFLKMYTKINLKWMKDLNVKTINLLEENIGGNFCDIRFGNDFLDMAPKGQATNINWNTSKILKCGKFPGIPVVKTCCFHCCGPGFNPF